MAGFNDAPQHYRARAPQNDTRRAATLEAANISKEGFYHGFAAKKDILSGIIARLTEQAVQATEVAADRIYGGALEKLNAFLAASIRWTVENSEDLRGEGRREDARSYKGLIPLCTSRVRLR